jgi:hypothetical protein
MVNRTIRTQQGEAKGQLSDGRLRFREADVAFEGLGLAGFGNLYVFAVALCVIRYGQSRPLNLFGRYMAGSPEPVDELNWVALDIDNRNERDRLDGQVHDAERPPRWSRLVGFQTLPILQALSYQPVNFINGNVNRVIEYRVVHGARKVLQINIKPLNIG